MELIAARSAAGLVQSKTSLPPPAFVSTHPANVVMARLSRLRRNVIGAAQLHGMADRGRRPARPWFVTLTYAHRDGWSADHVSAAVHAFRRWCDGHRIACRYEWVAELQDRGAVHYHLIAWLPPGYSMPKWDRQRTRSGALWWPHGMSNRKRVKGGAGYLAKYLSKMGEFHRFPKGARLYGVGGLSPDGRAIRSWWNLPEWARRLHGVGELQRRSVGLVVRATQEVLAARYAMRRVHGGFVLQQLQPLAERFHDAAYSRWPQQVTA